MGVNCLIFAGCQIASTLVKSAGPYRIATQLRNAGYTVQVIDFADSLTFDIKYKLALKKFVDKDTLWIGFSNTFLRSIFGIHLYSCPEEKEEFRRRNPNSSDSILEFISYAKSLNPNIKFVSGGVRTFDLEEYGFYLFKGHTDDQIVEFTDKCAHHQEIKQKIIFNKEYKNFNTCNIVYQKNDIFNGEQFLPIEISRGCIFRCKFCSFPLNGKKKFDYVRDYDILREEFIRNYDQFGITNYVFSDDTYNDSVEKIKGLYENVYKKLPFKIKFLSYIRLDLMMRFPEMADILAESGILAAATGMETLNPDNAKLIGKGVHPQDQIEYIFKLKEIWKNYNIRIDTGFIVGLPHDNRKKLEQLREWLTSSNNPLDYWYVHILDLYAIDKDINQSEFALNYKKYDYNLIKGEHKQIIWENPNIDMSYYEIMEFKDLLLKERDDCKNTKFSGFNIEQKTNLYKDLNFVLNNTAYEIEKMRPSKIALEENKKEYFKKLMQLDVP